MKRALSSTSTATSTATTRRTESGLLVPDPAEGKWYLLTIVVDAGGQATA
jgi:hypothetical protein